MLRSRSTQIKLQASDSRPSWSVWCSSHSCPTLLAAILLIRCRDSPYNGCCYSNPSLASASPPWPTHTAWDLTSDLRRNSAKRATATTLPGSLVHLVNRHDGMHDACSLTAPRGCP